jgi:hypothetical protein
MRVPVVASLLVAAVRARALSVEAVRRQSGRLLVDVSCACTT